MRIALAADVFPPMRSSGAVQLRDLSLELVRRGHRPTVLLPAPGLDRGWAIEDWRGVEVVRLRAPRTRDMSYARRALGELLMPFMMRRHLARSPLADARWDGVVWYSPTIFLGPLAAALKRAGSCRGYLIVRDIFPEWAVDMGLMRRGVRYRLLKAVERFQYSVADVIGVQTPANLGYFERWAEQPGKRVEVLQNWLADAPNIGCSITISETPLAGRRIFVYAGNMGVAQGMGAMLDLAERLGSRPDVGFLFVGRGSDAARLRSDAARRGLDNVLFYDEIEPSEIPGLFEQCHFGLVSLDRRHRTHNLPGKFLTYMRSGLPVLASINPGNDLLDLIARERVGFATSDPSAETLASAADRLLAESAADPKLPARCRTLADRLFAPEVAVAQIIEGLEPEDRRT